MRATACSSRRSNEASGPPPFGTPGQSGTPTISVRRKILEPQRSFQEQVQFFVLNVRLRRTTERKVTTQVLVEESRDSLARNGAPTRGGYERCVVEKRYRPLVIQKLTNHREIFPRLRRSPVIRAFRMAEDGT